MNLTFVTGGFIGCDALHATPELNEG
jgi:hypothetical protein